MIRGKLNHRCEAIVDLTLFSRDGTQMSMKAMIDTGFNASLTIPKSMTTQLQLIRKGGGSATLADGTVNHFDLYPINIEWDGVIREVMTYAVGDEVLIGMRLLRDYELTIKVRPGGLVQIIPINSILANA